MSLFIRQKALKLLNERLTGSDESKAPLLRPESPEEDSVSISIPSSGMIRSLSAGASLPAMGGSSQSSSQGNVSTSKNDVVIPILNSGL